MAENVIKRCNGLKLKFRLAIRTGKGILIVRATGHFEDLPESWLNSIYGGAEGYGRCNVKGNSYQIQGWHGGPEG